MNKELAVIILNYNGTRDTLDALNSIRRYEDMSLMSVFVVDNNSKMEQYHLLKESMIGLGFVSKESAANIFEQGKDFYLIRNVENLGFAKGNNTCIEFAKKHGYQYFLLMNNDTELVDNSISKLLYEFKHNDYAAMSTIINYWSEREEVWNAGGKIYLGTRKYYKKNKVRTWEKRGINVAEVSFLTGCFLLFDLKTIDRIGLLTEQFFFGEEDYEFGLRVKRKGGKFGVLTSTTILHKVGRSLVTTEKEKICAKLFVHHLNRLIDMKFYYSVVQWKVWRSFVLVYFGILIRRYGATNTESKHYCENLKIYSDHYNEVNQNLFLEIFNSNMLQGNG